MKTLAELQAIREKAREGMGIRDDKNVGTRVVVGMATCGIAAGARPVLNAIVQEVAREKLEDVTVSQTGCIGLCQYEPIVEVFPPDGEKITYVKMTAEKAIRVVHSHLKGGRVVSEYTVGNMKK